MNTEKHDAPSSQVDCKPQNAPRCEPAAAVNEAQADASLLRRQRMFMFPNALDFIVMAAWLFLSQMIAVFVCKRFGTTLPDTSLLNGPDADSSLANQLLTANSLAIMYTFSMVLGIAGILLYRRLRNCRGRVARFSAAGFNPSLILAGFVWILASGIVIEPLLSLLPDIPDTVGRGFFAILTATVLAPVFEEFLCRGIVLESVRSKYGTFTAWILSSVFFAVIHGYIASMVNALVIGSVLGYICIRSRSVFPSMILHAMNNGLALTMMSLGLSNVTLSELITDRGLYTAVYAVSAVICVVGAIVITVDMRKMHKMCE